MSFHKSSPWASKHRISQWVIIAGELMRIGETYNSLESMRTHMEIMAEKSYEDTRISLLMVRNEKSCPGELIWGHEKPNFSREGMRAHIEIIYEKSYEDMWISSSSFFQLQNILQLCIPPLCIPQLCRLKKVKISYKKGGFVFKHQCCHFAGLVRFCRFFEVLASHLQVASFCRFFKFSVSFPNFWETFLNISWFINNKK